MMARPPSLTPEREPDLFNLLATGLTIKDACRKAKVSYYSVALKKYTDETFRDKLARATLHGITFMLDEATHRLLHSSNKRISVDREVGHHVRWIAACRLAEYSKRLEISTPPPLHVTEAQKLSYMEVARRLHFVVARGAHYAEQQRQPRAPLLLEGRAEAVEPAPVYREVDRRPKPAAPADADPLRALDEHRRDLERVREDNLHVTPDEMGLGNRERPRVILRRRPFSGG
jgi:hypothetical protein